MNASESIGRLFLQRTCDEHLPPTPQSQGVPEPPLELPYPADGHLIPLVPAGEIQFPAVDLRAIMEQRQTLRRYSEAALSLNELSALLWLTQGVKRVTPRPITFRTVPSAGSRHPFETFLLVNRVEGLDPGLYRYLALEHALLEVRRGEGLVEEIPHACHDQSQVRNSAVTFLWLTDIERTTWRYPERGYRYAHLDAGHVCQNLYLAAETLGCGACAIASYNDDLANQAVGAVGDQFVAYVASVGKRAPVTPKA
jgi:SagB-type dehydrogenase family enzyme